MSYVECPRCEGENFPQAVRCQWCGKSLQKSRPMFWVGVILLVLGLVAALGTCGLSTSVLGTARSAFQEQSALLFGLMGLGTVFIVFIVPGAILLLLGRRRT